MKSTYDPRFVSHFNKKKSTESKELLPIIIFSKDIYTRNQQDNILKSKTLKSEGGDLDYAFLLRTSSDYDSSIVVLCYRREKTYTLKDIPSNIENSAQGIESGRVRLYYYTKQKQWDFNLYSQPIKQTNHFNEKEAKLLIKYLEYLGFDIGSKGFILPEIDECSIANKLDNLLINEDLQEEELSDEDSQEKKSRCIMS